MTITDLGSSTGVTIGNARIAPQSPVPADPRMIVSFGPVAIPIGLLLQIAQSFGIAVAVQPAAAPAGAPKKHQTVIGQLDFTQSQKPNRSIRRTPDNDIVVDHPQVSSKHAILVRVNNDLFVEVRGSANGTY